MEIVALLKAARAFAKSDAETAVLEGIIGRAEDHWNVVHDNTKSVVVKEIDKESLRANARNHVDSELLEQFLATLP